MPDHDFETVDPAWLEAADAEALDALPFGVIGLSPDGTAEVYNACEARSSGMRRDAVLGQPFFLVTGVCMNNFLVAQRFQDEERLDAVLDYVLTFRMRPTRVKLRLLKRPELRLNYVLIRR